MILYDTPIATAIRLLDAIQRRARNRDRFEAALHGITLPDDDGQVPVGKSRLRGFHERAKLRLLHGGA